MDRAHRIGQKKVVNVYRLITRGTLEDKIMGWVVRWPLFKAGSFVTLVWHPQDRAGPDGVTISMVITVSVFITVSVLTTVSVFTTIKCVYHFKCMYHYKWAYHSISVYITISGFITQSVFITSCVPTRFCPGLIFILTVYIWHCLLLLALFCPAGCRSSRCQSPTRWLAKTTPACRRWALTSCWTSSDWTTWPRGPAPRPPPPSRRQHPLSPPACAPCWTAWRNCGMRNSTSPSTTWRTLWSH